MAVGKPIAYGIDFGTSNSSIAAAFTAQVRLVEIADGPSSSILKSCIYIDRTGQSLVGDPAVRQYSSVASAGTSCAACDRARVTTTGIDSSCRWASRGGGCQDA